jgi:hypothetical protein
MKKKVLYYRARPDSSELVFALAERAECISRVHNAITSAHTWAEFRRLMPKKEYSSVLEYQFDDNDLPRPKSSDPFSSDQVPRYSDGDYPDWLQQEMAHVLPKSIVAKYGRIETTMHNGEFLQIDSEKESFIVCDLRAMGFVVVKRPDLYFY